MLTRPHNHKRPRRSIRWNAEGNMLIRVEGKTMELLLNKPCLGCGFDLGDCELGCMNHYTLTGLVEVGCARYVEQE